MFLIMTALAAVITTAIWYSQIPNDKFNTGTLCLMFWGATIMWFVDSVEAYLNNGKFFEISYDATLLGICVIIFALVIWEISLLVSDPRGVLKETLK